MIQPNRHEDSGIYRYGFNGMENDNEIKGDGNSIDYGARIYDPRIGRWFARDPLAGKYPSLSTYNYTANNPILFVDYDGRDFGIEMDEDADGNKTMIIVANIYTVSSHTAKQARKGVESWNNKEIQKDGVTVRFRINVIEPREITDQEAIEKNPRIVSAKGKTDKDLLRSTKKAIQYSEATQSGRSDNIGNTYYGKNHDISTDQQNKKSPVGGYTGSDFIVMNTYGGIDFGASFKLVSHEIGHLLGLNDEGGKYYTPGGRMEYTESSNGKIEMKSISDEDVNNIIEYVNDYTSGENREKGDPTVVTE